MNDTLKPFFDPKGIVVFGASQNPNKLGFGLARNLIDCGFRGNINFVNPKGGQLFGKKIYKNISDVSDHTDLAVLLISSKHVLPALMECADKKIKAVIISSGGFREIGEKGAKLEKECLDFAFKNNMRLMGPNCIGLLDLHFPLNTTFLKEPAKVKGSISFISHSGAICAAILDWANVQGFSFSKLVSLGNQADINETDILTVIGEDEHSKVITLYLEGVATGKEFVEESQRISKNKPIIALKVGKFESGKKAVESHTGALAGQETAFNAAFRRAGILRADTTEEMFEWARILASCSLPKSNKVAILTNAGGPGVTATDSIEGNGLVLASLSEETKASLIMKLPESASVENPIDMLASASPDNYSESLSVIFKDPDVDMVMVILPPPPMYSASDIVKAIIPVIKENNEKPVVVVPMGGDLILESINLLRDVNIPEYRFPENAASSLASLYHYAQIHNRKDQVVCSLDGVNKGIVKKILKKITTPRSRFLGVDEVGQIMEAYNIPFLKMKLATSSKEAGLFSDEVGYPVVLKIASPDISHKSDIGGVLININNREEAEKGYIKLLKIAKEKSPDSKILGAHIQKMINFGQEVILGAIQDPQFGALVMFGSGGTEVEGMDDVCFSLAPVTPDDLEYLFSNTWAGKKLDGFRNLAPADKIAVENAIIRLGQLVSDFPKILEIEINPLRVLLKNQGAIAVDVRIKI